MENNHWPVSLKKTKNRLAVYDILSNAHRPLMIAEIEELLKAKSVDMWLSTLYRVLQSLQEAKLVSKTTLLNSTTLYELTLHGHSHYAICTNCHRVIELDHCAMDLYQQQLLKNKFVVHGHKIEIYGLCHQCSSLQVVA